MNRILIALATALILIQPLFVIAAPADPDRRSERVEFAKGENSAVIKGQVKCYRYVDYQVRAGAGRQFFAPRCQCGISTRPSSASRLPSACQ